MNTVISDQQPWVSFLHCEELRALTNSVEEKIHLSFFFFFVSSSLDLSRRRTFSARVSVCVVCVCVCVEGGGVRSHPSHPPAYAPDFVYQHGNSF